MSTGNSPEAFGEILFKFEVLFHEWECDGYGYIVKDKDGFLLLVMSNHGRYYVAEEKELTEQLEFYRKTIAQTETALKLLRNSE